MKRVKFILIMFLVILMLTGCNKKDYKISDNIEISGKISNKSVVVNNILEKKAILELDKPVVVEGVKINKLSLVYDKDFKDGSNVSLEGTISENIEDDSDVSYSLNIIDVSPDTAILNVFSNEDFQMTIPSSLIKKCIVSNVDNGFVIYSKANKDGGGEVFRIVTMDSKDFRAVQDSENKSLEKIDSNLEKNVIVIYPSDNQIVSGNEGEYEEIGDAINLIKDSIRLKK